jgi:demethylmenaquinone methyltransferase/2-methoxy-6-polyprenyl-1,4-benzoquinol methylase
VIDHFGLLAPIYEKIIPPPDVSRLRDLLLLPVSGRLLDAGGGTGRVSSQFHSSVDLLMLIDASFGMLSQARLKNNIRMSQSHTERLPFADESFERILVVDAMHHFNDQRLAISDLVRVLKPEGRIVIEEPDIKHFRVKLVALAEKLALMRSRFYYPEEIGEILTGLGLTVQIERDDQLSAWVIGDKR